MDVSLVDSASQLIDGIKIELLDSIDGVFIVESHKFSIHVVNVLWNLIGGYKFNPNDELIKRNMECAHKIIDVLSHRNPYNVLPFLKSWFPNYVHHPEHLKLHKEIHDFTKVLINDAKEKRSQRLQSEPISFIEVFMDKIEDHRGDAETTFTNEQLEIILEDLFLAGLETTGTFLAWAVLFLVQNPDIQRKLRHDILAKNMKRTEDLQSIELKRLPYLKATVLETLRVGNVIPLPLPRLATQDIEIREYTIPKGSILFYNLYAMYNDEKYWTDPETFRPERFLQENGDIDIPKSERILNTVMGTGPRICFGETLAIDSLFVFLGALIINFKFEAIPGRQPTMENPNAAFCIGPRKYCMKITPELL
ncbi:hypothetical protein HA402_003158 [Bradysia odoriphaga]|nr:hypothetical protein HA402_003158 [Bradysia odoriphaga]